MSTEPSNIRIVRSQDRFKGAPNDDVFIQASLESKKRVMVEGDRTVLLNAAEQFNVERQGSDIIRMSGKITNIFNNVYSGKTSYTPFKNNLFYLDPLSSVSTGIWKGYPQYDEFTFFRTKSIDTHVPFVPKSAFTYNWGLYVTYPFENDTTQMMQYVDESLNSTIPFMVSDGIPFTIQNTKMDGKSYITFYCGTKHNLNISEWVELSFGYSGVKTFQVNTLGNEYYGSKEKVFSIIDLGYTGGTFNDGTTGTLKRVINIDNSGETKSEYYIRKHKVLTSINDYNLTKMGFESNPFRDVSKLEYSALTPNNVQRISVKDGSKSFGFVFEKDINISGLRDNQNRPVSELFTTIINKGYMGWFNNPAASMTSAINVGWNFNFLKDNTDSWFDNSSSLNKDNSIVTKSYNKGVAPNNVTFYYNEDLSINDSLKGDMCEWNNYEQTEIVISRMVHKFHYNSLVFEDNSTLNLPSGYLYYPHFPTQVRAYSSYVEDGNKDDADNLPDWAYYSENDKKWRWRDLYPYGYVDSSGVGVDHPFMNGAHYPFNRLMFLQMPQRRVMTTTDVIIQPIIDDCE